MAYLAALRPSLAALCPLKEREQETFVTYMDKVWEYVTPGDHGLNRVDMYTGGVARFCSACGVGLVPRALEVPVGGERPALSAAYPLSGRDWRPTARWPSSTWTTGPWRPWTSGTGCSSPPWRRGTEGPWSPWVDSGKPSPRFELWYDTAGTWAALYGWRK